MSKELKYVMIDIKPILFSNMMQHKEFKHLNPTSAGFCRISEREDGDFAVITYGESVSLSLKPKDQDARLIENILNEY